MDLNEAIKALVTQAVREAAQEVVLDVVQYPRLMITEKAAAYLDCSVGQIKNLVAAGQLTPVDLGTGDRVSRWWFDRIDLDKLIEARKKHRAA